MKILIVEDHPKIRENIKRFLKINGYLAEIAINGKEALEKIGYSDYDCIILDVNMPIMNGREFIKNLRINGNNSPVIALTSNSTLDDKIEMFDLGVDDYLVKPFELKELEMRIIALSKRKNKQINDKLFIKDIEIDFSKHKIFQQNNEIDFSNKEYLIIEFLARNKGYPKTKIQILENVWGESEENLELSSTTMESHISTIRKKLGSNFIKTIKGTGYIIE
ncbi:MAG: response regulator transcription factor [Candidatus Gracilibacteria bacterium]|nr:response regulator transcription factor [Candidatus Gracilibacteria bacterium]